MIFFFVFVFFWLQFVRGDCVRGEKSFAESSHFVAECDTQQCFQCQTKQFDGLKEVQGWFENPSACNVSSSDGLSYCPWQQREIEVRAAQPSLLVSSCVSSFYQCSIACADDKAPCSDPEHADEMCRRCQMKIVVDLPPPPTPSPTSAPTSSPTPTPSPTVFSKNQAPSKEDSVVPEDGGGSEDIDLNGFIPPQRLQAPTPAPPTPSPVPPTPAPTVDLSSFLLAWDTKAVEVELVVQGAPAPTPSIIIGNNNGNATGLPVGGGLGAIGGAGVGAQSSLALFFVSPDGSLTTEFLIMLFCIGGGVLLLGCVALICLAGRRKRRRSIHHRRRQNDRTEVPTPRRHHASGERRLSRRSSLSKRAAPAPSEYGRVGSESSYASSALTNELSTYETIDETVSSGPYDTMSSATTSMVDNPYDDTNDPLHM